MTKIAKKIMLVFCSFFAVFCLGVSGLLGLNTNKNVTAKAATSNSFTAININGAYNASYCPTTDHKVLRITFASAVSSDAAVTRGQEYALGDALTLNGIAINERTKTIDGEDWYLSASIGSGKMEIVYKGLPAFSANVPQIKLELATATEFGTSLLQPFALYYNGTNWQTAEYTAPIAAYTGIVDGFNFKAHYDGSRYGLVLGFDKPMATAAGNLFNTNENTFNVTLNGKEWNTSNVYTRCMKVDGNSNPNTIEFVFFNYLTTGTQYTTDGTVTAPLAHGTVLKIGEGTVVNGYIIPEITLYFNEDTQQWQKDEPAIKFLKIDENINYYQSDDYYLTDLKFSFDTTTNEQYIWFGEAKEGYEDLASKIYWTAYGETTKNSFNIIFGMNGNVRLMDHNTIFPTPYATITIEEGAVIEGKSLPATTLYVGADGKWTTEEPVRMAEFVKIDETINYYNDNGYRLTDLKFDFDTTNGVHYILFGEEQTEYEGLKEKIYWTAYGETTKHSFSLVSGVNGNLRLWDAEANCPTPYSTVTIEEGTVIEGHTLPNVTLYVAADGKWTTEEQTPPTETPDPTLETANFVSTDGQWQVGYGNADQRVLYLVFDKALAPTTTSLWGANNNYAASSSGNLMSQMTIGGNHVTFGSQIILFIEVFVTKNKDSKTLEIMFVNNYFKEMKHADCLHIPEGTLFGDVALGEVTLYYNEAESKWQTEKPAPIVSGFSAVEGGSIRIDKENGGLRFETRIEKETYDSLVETYGKENLQIGTYILPEAWLISSGRTLKEYVTRYTADGGYYIDISTWNETRGDFGFANSDSEGKITDGNSYYKYYGTISKVKDENYLENFIGVGYLWITDQNGDEWLYLTHDGNWSRNVYEIAKEAYRDTENVADKLLYGVTPYFDKVIEITTDGSKEDGIIYDIDEVLTARSYSYTKPTDYSVTVANGVITIATDAVYNVMINDLKAGVMTANATAYADYYALNAELYATPEEASAINYGIGEPTQELWGAKTVEGFNKEFPAEMNTYSTASNIAKVNASFGGNTARIWFQMADVCWPSVGEFKFQDGAIDTIQGVLDDFKAEGVTNISLMSGVANYRSTKNYYNVDTKTWYTFWDVLGGETATPHLGLVVLPNEDDYEEFLALQKEYFKQLALNLRGVTVIEILNELELSNNKFRTSIATGVMPDMALVAQAAMDICKMATEGVKEAGKNIKITMPSLACVTEVKDGENVTRYATTDLVTAEYDYIKSVGGNPDDYFQIINVHPYVFLSQDTSNTNYLYAKGSGTAQTTEQIANRWRTYVEGLRAIFVANGDAEKPVWITEFGIADYELCGTNSDVRPSVSKWADYANNTLARQTEVFQTIWSVIQDMPYIDTVIFFRLGDYAHTGDHSYADCGEASYGMYDKNGALKDIGKKLYTIVTGKTDYENLVQTIS